MSRPGRARPMHAGLRLAAENRAFLVSGMIWLLVAAALLAWNGTLLSDGATRPAELHVFTAGFVLSVIYGLAAHMLPRFTGNSMRGGASSWLQLVLLQAGLVLFIAGFAVHDGRLALTGALLLASTTIIFVWRMWPVLWPHGKKG